MSYIWELDGWPALGWDDRVLSRLLARVSREQGWILGKMETLGFELVSGRFRSLRRSDIVEHGDLTQRG